MGGDDGLNCPRLVLSRGFGASHDPVRLVGGEIVGRQRLAGRLVAGPERQGFDELDSLRLNKYTREYRNSVPAVNANDGGDWGLCLSMRPWRAQSRRILSIHTVPITLHITRNPATEVCHGR